MPPKAATTVKTAMLRSINAELQLKLIMNKRKLRPRAEITIPAYEPRRVWLSCDEPHRRLGKLIVAWDDVSKEDIPHEFKVALLNAGAHMSFAHSSDVLLLAQTS